MFNVLVDPSSLVESNSGNVIGRIHIDSEIGSFPDPGWFDFPAVVLAWWIAAVRSKERPFELRFMDGPFGVECTAEGDIVELRFWREHATGFDTVGVGRTSLSVMEVRIMRAAEHVVRRCLQQGFPTQGLDLLLGHS